MTCPVNFANFMAACCIITWIELSHALQWFVSWGIFTWLGKVFVLLLIFLGHWLTKIYSSYGFYLMQFITIYAFMPHIVLGLDARGNGYWDTVIPAYVCCLIINIIIAWVAYHAFDRVGLKLGKWIWDGLFVTKPKNATALPLKSVRAFFNMCKTSPGYFAKSIKQWGVDTWASTKYAVWIAFHWRSPVRLHLEAP